MKQGKFSWWWAVILIIVVVGAAAMIYGSQKTVSDKPELNAFAQCLKSKDWTMYGAYWCPHCQREKANFGSAFQYVNYVECTQATELCNEKKIEGYPTWIGPDGKHYEGEQGLAKLSELSGCALPGVSK